MKEKTRQEKMWVCGVCGYEHNSKAEAQACEETKPANKPKFKKGDMVMAKNFFLNTPRSRWGVVTKVRKNVGVPEAHAHVNFYYVKIEGPDSLSAHLKQKELFQEQDLQKKN